MFPASLVHQSRIWHNSGMQKPAHILFFLLFLACHYAADAMAAGFYQPGFRTMGTWTEEPPIRVDLAIWYPAIRQPKDLNYPPWTIRGALNARPAEGKFPLLVLSHATPEDRFAHHNLAAWLARAGFVVAAPCHSRDYMDNMDDLFTWNQLDRRAREIAKAVEMTLSQKDLAAIVDRERIGLIGFGSGATAALLLGGAMPNCSGWRQYCKQAGQGDVYCSPWAKDRMAALCQGLPLAASMADPQFKAMAAIAPGYGMLFDAGSFSHFYPPLLLVSAGRDHFNAARLHCEPLAKLLGKRARFLELPDADAGALMAPCPPSLAAELPELCQSVSPQRREALHRELADALLTFFNHYLVNAKNLHAIPQTPSPTPEAAARPGGRAPH